MDQISSHVEQLIWYVEAQVPGKESNVGSAVAVLVQTSSGEQRRVLLTCGHVVRGISRDEQRGLGRPLSTIKLWRSGKGQDYLKTARISTIKPLIDDDVPNKDRPITALDWVILEVDDDLFSKAGDSFATEFISPKRISNDSCCVIGFPGGLQSHKIGDLVRPTISPGLKIRCDGDGEITISPDETRGGMSGGGVFDTDGRLIGLHRARSEKSMRSYAVSIEHIQRELKALGHQLVTDVDVFRKHGRKSYIADDYSNEEFEDLVQRLQKAFANPNVVQRVSNLAGMESIPAGLDTEKGILALLESLPKFGCHRIIAFLTEFAVRENGQTIIPRDLLNDYEWQGLVLLGELVKQKTPPEIVKVAMTAVEDWTWNKPRTGAQLTVAVMTYQVFANAETRRTLLTDSTTNPILGRFVGELLAGLENDVALTNAINAAWLRICDALKIPTDLPIVAKAREKLDVVLVKIDASLSPGEDPKAELVIQRFGKNGSVDLITPASTLECLDPKYLPSVLAWIRKQLNTDFGSVFYQCMLPRKWLTAPIDQCPMAIDSILQLEIGAESQVVVRLSEPIDGRPQRMQELWERLKSVTSPDHCYWSDGGKDLKAEYLKMTKRPMQISCLVLTTALSISDDPSRLPAFHAALLAGVPLVIWSRDSAVVSEFKTTAKGWLSTPLNVPQLVQDCRRDSAGDEQQLLGRHVSVLYEDIGYQIDDTLLRRKGARSS